MCIIVLLTVDVHCVGSSWQSIWCSLLTRWSSCKRMHWYTHILPTTLRWTLQDFTATIVNTTQQCHVSIKHCKKNHRKHMGYQLSGLVVRVSALKVGGSQFDPWSSRTRDLWKLYLMPSCLSFSIKGWIWGKTLPHTSVMSTGCTCTSSCLQKATYFTYIFMGDISAKAKKNAVRAETKTSKTL